LHAVADVNCCFGLSGHVNQNLLTYPPHPHQKKEPDCRTIWEVVIGNFGKGLALSEKCLAGDLINHLPIAIVVSQQTVASHCLYT